MKTKGTATKQLSILAALASDLGFEVTFVNHTVTEGHAAGSTKIGINISTLTQED